MGKNDFQNHQRVKEAHKVLAAYRADIHPVDQASSWADEMVMRDLRGPGDLDNALHRVGRRIGVGYRLLWNLRYRRPKDINATAYLKIWSAWEAIKDHQMRALEHDIARTRAEAGNDHHSLAEAEAVLGAHRSAHEAPVASADHRPMAMTGGGQ